MWLYVCEIPALGSEVETSLASMVNCRPGENLLKKKKKDGWDGWYSRKDIYMPVHAHSPAYMCVCADTQTDTHDGGGIHKVQF